MKEAVCQNWPTGWSFLTPALDYGGFPLSHAGKGLSCRDQGGNDMGRESNSVYLKGDLSRLREQ